MSDEASETAWFPPELRDVRSALVALAGFLGTVLPAGVAVCDLLRGQPEHLAAYLGSAVLSGTAVAVFVGWFSTRYRALGLVLPASVTMAVTAGWSVAFGGWPYWIGWVAFASAVASLLVLGRFVQSNLRPGPEAPETVPPAVVRAHAVAGLSAVGLLMLGNLIVVVLSFWRLTGLVGTFTRYHLVALAVLLCAWCWVRLLRPFVELTVEPVFRVLYRIRASGPGVQALPQLGPVLVIANHASWFDPCFVAEFIPRPITPMMTSRFFDIWFLRPLLKHVIHVIRVPDALVRREAPELQQAVEALARGECVVIFPEGYLQRKAEVPLRRFGQGVWHILSARPDTPVVACWVEGGWGSKFSYFNGPPGRNKRMDFRHPIRVGVSEPHTVPADVLADQMATRIHLMNRVSAARSHLGMPPLPTFELPATGEAEKESVQPEPSS